MPQHRVATEKRSFFREEEGDVVGRMAGRMHSCEGRAGSGEDLAGGDGVDERGEGWGEGGRGVFVDGS